MPSQNGGNPAAPPIPAITDPPAAASDGTPEPVATGAAPPGAAVPRRRHRRQRRLIYHISRLADRRGYVGVTKRPLPVRLAVHCCIALRRPKLGGPGTLAEAIRQAHADGLSFESAFRVEILAVAYSPDEARRLERAWIAALGTARPHGFNIMPGGASLGGPANATPVVIEHPARGILYFASLMDAVADIDRERRDHGLPPLQLGSIYARRAMGWPMEEALELADHADGRRKRPAFLSHGRSYDTLHDLAVAEGLPIDTIRSKLHRARQAGCDAGHDAARDRRLPGGDRTGGVGCGRQPPLALPHPLDPGAAPVDATMFARLTGVPKGTVLHRYHRFVQARGSAASTRDEMLAALTRHEDRRMRVRLQLPNRQRLSGGVREVIRAVLGNADLEQSRAERLSLSGIRARLRRVPGWPRGMARQGVLWAFGFRPDAKPLAGGWPVAAE